MQRWLKPTLQALKCWLKPTLQSIRRAGDYAEFSHDSSVSNVPISERLEADTPPAESSQKYGRNRPKFAVWPFRARPFLDGKDAVTLATDILALDQEQFSAAFRKSPMKRAKLAGLRRNAAVVLANARRAAVHEPDA